MNNVTIQNQMLRATISSHGAELTSLVSREAGIEYIWQADPKFWNRHAPHLFPIVGSLKDKKYIYQGREYQMGQHGFARDSNFELAEQTERSVLMKLKHSAESMVIYPFRFELCVEYVLEGARLLVRYSVYNPDVVDMLFSIGGHPAFRCPMRKGEHYHDYYLEFSEPENVERKLLTADGLISTKSEPFLQNQSIICLTRDTFKQGAIVFERLRSKVVKLINRATGDGVAVNIDGFPFLGIWAKTGADFVCIEPWCGIADLEDSEQRLEDKHGIIKLKREETLQREFSIDIFSQ